MIYLVRHGQTELNKKKVLQGRSNVPLNETGEAQAKEAKEKLQKAGAKITRVFSSPLQRAVMTANIIAPGLEVKTDERLIEMDYGPYEGASLMSLPPEILEFFSDFINNPAPDGMEQLSSVVKRTGEFIEELKGIPGDILITTHAIALKGILENLDPESNGDYWSRNIGNCAVYVIETSEDGFGVPAEVL